MKRIFAVIALGILVAACSNGPKSGTVVGRHHESAYSYWVAGVYMPGHCDMIGKVENCTPGMQIPGHEQYVPEAWSLKLDNDEHSGWRGVDEHDYDSCQSQDHYPECAGA